MQCLLCPPRGGSTSRILRIATVMTAPLQSYIDDTKQEAISRSPLLNFSSDWFRELAGEGVNRDNPWEGSQKSPTT